MQRFVGTHVNKLDAKGRVSIPAPFRQVLNQQGGVLYVARALGNPALNGFGEAQFAEVDAQLKGMNPQRNKDYAAYAMAAFGDLTTLSCDEQGRVVLPAHLIEMAGITDKVAFVGLNTIFEIWNPDTFEPVRQARWERIEALYQAGEGA